MPLGAQAVRLVRQHLHLVHVAGEEDDVVADEADQAIDGVGAGGHRLLGAAQHLLETPTLDVEQQLVLALHVVVHAGQAHPGRPREVAHGRGVVALLGEDPGRCAQQGAQALVVATLRHSNVRSRSWGGNTRRMIGFGQPVPAVPLTFSRHAPSDPV